MDAKKSIRNGVMALSALARIEGNVVFVALRQDLTPDKAKKGSAGLLFRLFAGL